VRHSFKVSSILLLAVILFLSSCSAYSEGISENDNNSAKPVEGAQAGKEHGLEGSSGVSALEELQYSFRNIASSVLPVVVQINVVEVVTQQTPEGVSPWDFFFGPSPDSPEGGTPEEREFRRPGLGSGVIVRKDGKKVYVLTNNHVVGEADEISILLHDQRTFTGKLVGKDVRKDLALVVFETKDDVPVAVLGDSDTLQVGDWAVAVGNPLGLESTVTVGIISALGRRGGPGSNISDFIQTDAAINPGNSGGALVNIKGEVIGINTWIASTTGSYIGFGFAIPINNAKKDIEDFIKHGAVQYGWLGVSIRDPLDSMRTKMMLEGINGGMTINVYKGSPADKGGILPGDYVTSINGREIKNANDLVLVVGDLPAGKAAEFDVIRYGKEVKLSVKIAVRDEEKKIISRSKNMWPGMLAISSKDAAAGSNVKQEPFEGVQIVIVYSDSPAAIAGLKQGDIIKEINDSKISNVLEFFKALNDKEKKEIRFRIERQDTELSIGLFR